MKLYDLGITIIIVFVFGLIFGGAIQKETHFIKGKTTNNQ